jgi:putative transposase
VSRTARLVLPGAHHYVLCRSRHHCLPFRSPGTCECYLGLLHEYAGRTGLALRAWCLLPSEVHLVAVPRRTDSIARAIRATHVSFDLAHHNEATNVHKRWRDRPQTRALQADFVPWAIRRVENLPVRLGLAVAPAQYEWSSSGGGRPGYCETVQVLTPSTANAVPTSPSRGELGLEFWLRRCLQTGRPMGRDCFRQEVLAYASRKRHYRTVT